MKKQNTVRSAQKKSENGGLTERAFAENAEQDFTFKKPLTAKWKKMQKNQKNHMIEAKIRVMTYEDCRLEFFCDLRTKLIKRMEREAGKAHKESYLSDTHRKASEYGMQVGFLDDVIKLLTDNASTDEKSAYCPYRGRKIIQTRELEPSNE